MAVDGAPEPMNRGDGLFMTEENRHIIAVTLDEQSFVRRNPDIEHERAVATHDLLEANRFVPKPEIVDGDGGPYALHIRVQDDRMIFDIHREDEKHLGHVALALKSFRRIIKDYFLVCESYFSAIKTETPSRIEAIDMGRRGLHNEGAELLREQLSGKVDIDDDTARRLFTLVCVLHIQG